MGKFVCLLGNGVSIPYNSALAVDCLAQSLIGVFAGMGATNAQQALREHAVEVQGRAVLGFEDLLGPLEGAARALPSLRRLAPLNDALSNQAIHGAIATVQTFTDQLHRLGLGVTLQHISERAHNQEGRLEAAITPVATALADFDPDAGNITIASLNYDGLVHAGLMKVPALEYGNGWGDVRYRICDLADGRGGVTDPSWHDVPIDLGPRSWGALPLRTGDELPPSSLRLLQLHGSLAWLEHPHHGAWRFTIDDLRDGQYWQRFRDGDTDWSPLLVLTDKKERVVKEWPFALAYQIFTDNLVDASRWLVVGYGFGDVPVNASLQAAFDAKSDPEKASMRLLVVDYDPSPSNAKEQAKTRQVADVLQIPAAQISVDLTGSPGFVQGEWFANWKG